MSCRRGRSVLRQSDKFLSIPENRLKDIVHISSVGSISNRLSDEDEQETVKLPIGYIKINKADTSFSALFTMRSQREGLQNWQSFETTSSPSDCEVQSKPASISPASVRMNL